MADRINRRLEELGITVPQAQEPRVAKIKGTAIIGNTLYISGMIPQWEGEVRYIGKVGEKFSIDDGREAARLSALNVIAQARAALDGDLDRIKQIAKVSGFVNCTPEMTESHHRRRATPLSKRSPAGWSRRAAAGRSRK